MIYAFKQVSRETTLASTVNKKNVTHLILAPTDLAEQFSLVILDERWITSEQNVGCTATRLLMKESACK